MEKKTTPAITVIFYIIGILFLAIAAFMLVAALSYTRTYLQSYDASFADMWSNSVQYIIAQFTPYLGVGIVCLGIGKVIKEARNIVVNVDGAADNGPDEEAQARQIAAADKIADRIKGLATEVEATREIFSIKMDEKEKRDSFRIKETGEEIIAALGTGAVAAAAEQPEPAKIEEPVAEPAEDTAKADEPAVAKATPPIFTVSRRMVMPACPVQKATPPIFTVSRRMVMPACPAKKATPPIFTVSRRMVMPACPAQKATPPIFTVSRRMVMPACPAREEKTGEEPERVKLEDALQRRDTFSREDLEKVLDSINRK